MLDDTMPRWNLITLAGKSETDIVMRRPGLLPKFADTTADKRSFGLSLWQTVFLLQWIGAALGMDHFIFEGGGGGGWAIFAW